jgi:hypothetical protein
MISNLKVINNEIVQLAKIHKFHFRHFSIRVAKIHFTFSVDCVSLLGEVLGLQEG